MGFDGAELQRRKEQAAQRQAREEFHQKKLEETIGPAAKATPPPPDPPPDEEPKTQSLLTTCRVCNKQISVNAASCPHCGEPMATQTRHPQMVPQYTYSPGLAGVLSFFIPGLGQLYRGKIFGGLLWFIFTAIGYLFLVVPGLIIHLFSLLSKINRFNLFWANMFNNINANIAQMCLFKK